MAEKQTSFGKRLALALAQGAMAMGEGMTGRPFLSNYLSQQMKQDADEWKKQLQEAELASKGIRIDEDGNPVRDESLMSPMDKFLRKGQFADAMMKISQIDPSVMGGQGVIQNGQPRMGAPNSMPQGVPPPPGAMPTMGQRFQGQQGGQQGMMNSPYIASKLNALGNPTGYELNPLMQKQEEQGIAAKGKWNTESAERNIKFEVMTPKLQNYMDLGGRAYKELRDVAKGYGIELNFETGGLNALVAMATKNVAIKTKLAPLMKALSNLRPELGTELMRQLGAFRSGQMAEKFEKTLAQFSGDIREDIANMSTTLVKNKANTVLLDENGERLSDAERNRKMEGFEANLIRKYNFMYRGMELTTKPYTAGRSLEWLAKNSEFNGAEESIIKNAMDDNPKFSREKIIAKLIEKGLL